MAGRISGITIEIDGNTTKLQKSLKSLDNSLKTSKSNLKDIEKLLKLDPTNTELLTQKQKNLESSIKGTKLRLNELKTAQEGVAEGSDEWDALQREIIDTEQQLKSLESQYRSFGSVAAQQVAAVGEKMKDIGGKMTKVGEDLTKYVTLPIVGVAAKGVASFAEVDKTMQLTNATMGNTADEAALLNKAMEEAAANSTFGMSDAATATLNFARAGLDAEQAAAALAPAMNLAAGEGGDLDTVSAGLIGTIRAFAGSFDEAGHYADVFANACNNSSLDINSLSENIASAGNVFASAGYTVEDLALYMGIMANRTIPANEAATALSSSFSRLVKPSKEAATYMDKIGFSMLNADGTMKDSRQVITDLQASFSGLSESEKIAAASAIFGKTQYDKWLAIINTAPEEIDQLSAALKENGTTNEMADAMMGGFGGSIEKLKSSLDVLMTSLGRLVAEYLQPVIDKVQGWIDKFNALDDGTKNTIVKIGLIVAAIGPLLVIGGKLITGIGMLLTFAPMIAAAIAAINWPIVLIVAFIGLLVAAGVALYRNWDTLKEKAAAFWQGIKDGFEQTKNDAVNSFNAMKDGVANAWESIKSKASSVWEGIKNAIVTPIQNAWNTVKGIVDRIKGMFNFTLSFPHIKLPHFNWTWSDLGLIKIPHISVEWYKKAYEQPYMFTSPTVVGNRGFGDGNGAEMVYGRDNLMRDIKEAMGSANNQPIVITVQSILDGRIVGQSVSRYERSMARAMGA